LDEQRTMRVLSAATSGGSPQVVAPPPSVSTSGGSRSGSMVALSLHPAVGAPTAPVVGNRRGSFAATPEGHRGAVGAAGGSAGASAESGSGAAKSSDGSLPSGLYVGKSANPTSAVAGDPAAKVTSGNTVNPRLLAGARAPRVSRVQPENANKTSEIERAVFGDRKVYSLFLNMPNLNSGGGSWIIRFAALNADSTASTNGTASESASGELSSPLATSKVDPAYPLALPACYEERYPG